MPLYITKFATVILVFILLNSNLLSNDNLVKTDGKTLCFIEETISDSIFFTNGYSNVISYLDDISIPREIQIWLKAKYNYYLSNYRTAHLLLDSIKNSYTLYDYIQFKKFNDFYIYTESCVDSAYIESYDEMNDRIPEQVKHMHYHTINSYLMLYAFSSKYFDFNYSKSILESANEFVLKNFGSKSYIYHLIKFYLAENHLYQRNYETTTRAFEFTLKQSVKQFPEEEFFKRAYYYDGANYWQKREYAEAQKKFQLFLDLSPNHYFHYKFWANLYLGEIYDNSNEVEKTEKYLNESLEIALKNDFLAGYLEAAGYLMDRYLRLNDKKEYKELFTKISDYVKDKNMTFEEEIMITKIFSKFYYNGKNYKECITACNPFFTKLAAIVDFDTINISPTQSYIPVFYYSNVSYLYWLQVIANYHLWKQSRDILYLNESYKKAKTYFELETYRLNNQSDRKSMLKKLEWHKKVFNIIFSPGYQIWEETHDTAVFNEMLNFMDRSRSVLFRNSLKDNALKNQLGVSDELLLAEINIKRAIDSINLLLTQTNLRSNEILEDKLGILYRRNDSVKFQIEKSYPEYKALSNRPANYTIKDIQKNLPQNATLICYQVTHNAIYIQLINDSAVAFTYSDISSNDLELISEFYNLISNYSISMFESPNFKKFIDYSRYFYSLLIEPVSKDIIGDKLYILPDKQLNYIPFDLLLTEEELDAGSPISYAALPYLINDYSVSILYSFEQLSKKNSKINNPQVLALSPSYSSTNHTQVYNNLSGAHEEVDYLSMQMEGKFLKGEKATKQVLNRVSDNYDILHMGLHTNINPTEPLYSQLLFSSDTSDHLNNLFIYETYGLKLSAPMVVLGGCSTGFGSMFSGEGILNLARNFFFLGAQNTIAALWPIADKSGSKITTAFYDALCDGVSSDIALRKAKLEYLASTGDLKCHPYFWANMQSIGPPVTFTFDNNYGAKNNYRLVALIILGLLVGGYIFKRFLF